MGLSGCAYERYEEGGIDKTKTTDRLVWLAGMHAWILRFWDRNLMTEIRLG